MPLTLPLGSRDAKAILYTQSSKPEPWSAGEQRPGVSAFPEGCLSMVGNSSRIKRSSTHIRSAVYKTRRDSTALTQFGALNHNFTSSNTTMFTPPATLFESYSNASCILTPEVTEGPYYVSGEHIRQNVIESQEGVPVGYLHNGAQLSLTHSLRRFSSSTNISTLALVPPQRASGLTPGTRIPQACTLAWWLMETETLLMRLIWCALTSGHVNHNTLTSS